MNVKLDETLIKEVNRFVKDNWADPVVVTKGTEHDTSNAERFAAVENSTVTGYILYEFCETQCEFLVLESMKQIMKSRKVRNS